MHKQCFDVWEQSALTFLRNSGRARNWSEKQMQQNLWTKKGFDVAYKACDCKFMSVKNSINENFLGVQFLGKCGHGHMRKDLDVISKVRRSICCRFQIVFKPFFVSGQRRTASEP